MLLVINSLILQWGTCTTEHEFTYPMTYTSIPKIFIQEIDTISFGNEVWWRCVVDSVTVSSCMPQFHINYSSGILHIITIGY